VSPRLGTPGIYYIVKTRVFIFYQDKVDGRNSDLRVGQDALPDSRVEDRRVNSLANAGEQRRNHLGHLQVGRIVAKKDAAKKAFQARPKSFTERQQVLVVNAQDLLLGRCVEDLHGGKKSGSEDEKILRTLIRPESVEDDFVGSDGSVDARMCSEHDDLRKSFPNL